MNILIFLYLNQNIFCGNLEEPSQGDAQVPLYSITLARQAAKIPPVLFTLAHVLYSISLARETATIPTVLFTSAHVLYSITLARQAVTIPTVLFTSAHVFYNLSQTGCYNTNSLVYLGPWIL